MKHHETYILSNLSTYSGSLSTPLFFCGPQSPLEVPQRWKCQHRCWKRRWGRNPTRTSKYTGHQIGSRNPAIKHFHVWKDPCAQVYVPIAIVKSILYQRMSTACPSYTGIYSIWHDLDMWKNVAKYIKISSHFPRLLNNPAVCPTLQHWVFVGSLLRFTWDQPTTTANSQFNSHSVSFRIPIKLPQHPEPVQHSANQCNKNSTVKMAMQTLGVWKSSPSCCAKIAFALSELLSYNL